MSSSQYTELDKLIKEYEEDSRSIRSERVVMKNYPKVLVMSAASSFEYNIKNRCQEFLDDPKLPINIHYPIINSLASRKPKVDQMFAKLEAYDNSSGIAQLNATSFYNFFGGQAFKLNVENVFNAKLSIKLQDISNRINYLSPLIGQGENYDFDYAKQCDILNELNNCSFENAESAYLNLKLRRNRVAHDYINGLSDTFDDIEKFYNKAIIYVISLEEAIKSLTN